MHTFNETAAGVPAFLAKLWRLVEDSDTNQLIYWQTDGRSFIIQNQAQFARELLPLNYKHNNMASFIRQLNMYGFHKITSIDNGGLKFDKDEMEFSHPCFQRDQPYLLEHIKRKIANPKPPAQTASDDKINLKPETVHKVMNEVKVMRSRQETLDSRFSAMKQENEALWREVAVLRQKHIKQQQIVNKLIQFLVTLVQPTRGGSGINNMSGVKRRFQLMINDVPESAKKCKASESNAAPVIHELTEDLFDEVNYAYPDDDDDSDGGPQPHVMSPDGQSNPDHDLEDVSSLKNYKIEQNTTIVDNPDSENDEDQYHSNNDGHDGDTIDYIINEIIDPSAADAATTTQPTDEWLQENVLGPTTTIKQEPLSIDSVIGGYDHTTGKNQFQMPATPMINRRMRAAAAAATIALPTTANKSLLVAHKKNAQPLHLKITKGGQKAMPSVREVARGAIADGGGGGKIMTAAGSNSTSGKKINQFERRAGTSSSSYAAAVATAVGGSVAKKSPTKVYTNKSDFISTEMPNELFDSHDGCVSPLMTDLMVDSSNPTLSQDLASKMGGGCGGSTAVASGSDYNATDGNSYASSNYAITKYNNNNKFGKNDELIRSANDVNMQLDNMQGDIESIKELLKCDDYSLDTSGLLNIFGDLEAPYGLSMNQEFSMDKRNDDVAGSELMTYQPYNSSDISDLLDKSDGAEKNADDDYLSQDLNTPCIDQKSISFLTD